MTPQPSDDASDARGMVLVVGSLNADLTVRTERLPGPGETVHGEDLVTTPGGKSANQAVAAALLGADVALLGRVGDDDHGRMLRGSLEHAGADTSHVEALEGVATGVAVIAVDAAGENNIILSPGANGRLKAADVEAAQDFFALADGRPGSVLTLCLEVDLGAVIAAASAAHKQGVRVILNISPYQPIPSELLELTDVLLVNAHELADLLGEDAVAADGTDATDWAQVAGKVADQLAHAPGYVVVTLGKDGALVLDPGSRSASDRIPAPTIQAVDTVGSGDAFLGALATRLAAGDDVPTAAAYAVNVGAMAATRHGAQASYPTTAELEDWLRSR
ncbi:ribokinase [Arsenicicoccus piscis]|uniref:Ribokinase n=2 Tax=Arsenicicoccus piscis TaxID=673954 RepID=A0ABQ6HQ84_9MICO|nr:ribokinase [Arsenicicoccus piscis]MCH8628012.1 ribokinase [Arsenicicoccus piscis]GMA20636.1 ribokinase [Arsenicicoccus piscis]